MGNVLTAAKRRSMTIRKDSEYSMIASSFIHWERGNLYSTVISGGRIEDRTAVELSLIRMARQTRDKRERPVPVIVLEQGNPVLEQKICREGGNARLDGESVSIDPLTGLTDREIAGRLYAVAKVLDPNCDSGLRGRLRIGCELLRKTNRMPGIRTLSELPWDRLNLYIDQMVDDEVLEQDEALAFIARLGQLTGDMEQVEDLLDQLREEYDTIAGEEVPTVSLEQLISGNGVACLRLLSGMRALPELVALSLMKSTLLGKQFLLVADSVTIPSENCSLRELLCTHSSEYALVMSYDDMPSKLGESFSSLVSGSTNIILFSHQSGTSTEAWANFIGKSYQIKESDSYAESYAQTQMINRQISKSHSREEELRFTIAAETIQHLPYGEAIVQSGEPGAGLWFIDFPRLFSLQQNKTLQLRGR